MFLPSESVKLLAVIPLFTALATVNAFVYEPGEPTVSRFTSFERFTPYIELSAQRPELPAEIDTTVLVPSSFLKISFTYSSSSDELPAADEPRLKLIASALRRSASSIAAM